MRFGDANPPRDLILVDRAKQALAEASNIDEIKEVIDRAEAIRLYFRKAADGLDAQNQAAEIKIRAERRAGELLREIDRERRGGDRRSKSRGGALKLADLGINKNQSSRWQQIAAIDEPTFEQHIAKTKNNGRELTSAATLKLARQLASQAPVTPSDEPNDSCNVVTDLSLLIGQELFQAIYADPPWPYDNQGTRAATNNHYSTMTLQDIAQLPVTELLAENAHLHLWTTNGFLPQAFELITAWGFRYKSCLVWVKPQMGIGNYWRVSHEFLLLGVKGNLPFRDHSKKSWHSSPRLEHSKKPEVFRHLIQQVSPGPYLELFARTTSPGWHVWGNQIKQQCNSLSTARPPGLLGQDKQTPHPS